MTGEDPVDERAAEPLLILLHTDLLDVQCRVM
jgi:hypothetical protein